MFAGKTIKINIVDINTHYFTALIVIKHEAAKHVRINTPSLLHLYDKNIAFFVIRNFWIFSPFVLLHKYF